MGDPPMEEQGLNSVFDGDRSTWEVIKSFGESLKKSRGRRPVPVKGAERASRGRSNG
jgi:hypothetical protein